MNQKILTDEFLQAHKGALHKAVIEQVEKKLINEVLVKTRGNQTQAAKILGINRGTFRKKLLAAGILK
ncbi:helix-turn-helix domain-containing protein [Acinetobacter guerrae]|uniref:helix-turn-helix domain-containing protein n=1 Tax=Acinetobacter guerrae TaxID=1843371 RepID=UPI00125EB528|nr:helix-turn-helix domain-containing protein [Acinetobacter guerrae]